MYKFTRNLPTSAGTVGHESKRNGGFRWDEGFIYQECGHPSTTENERDKNLER